MGIETGAAAVGIIDIAEDNRLGRTCLLACGHNLSIVDVARFFLRLDPGGIESDYLEAGFGKAAPTLKRYFDRLEKQWRAQAGAPVGMDDATIEQYRRVAQAWIARVSREEPPAAASPEDLYLRDEIVEVSAYLDLLVDSLVEQAEKHIDVIMPAVKKGMTLKSNFLLVEGHTDNVGSPEVNERVGMERAESVKRYLYEQHQIPLHKMNVISYGEEKPVAPNNKRDGRAQNRRVVVKVLS